MIKKRYSLPDLPYEYDELSPAIGEEQLKIHHTKHHQGYVDKTNKILDKIEESKTEKIKHNLQDLSFNLNGHLLHSLFWENMQKYSEQNKPSDELIGYLEEYYSSVNEFKNFFSQAASTVEGSGWCVLLRDSDGSLQIMQVENHNHLILTGFEPILILDVWEHAYYLDYQNDRASFVENWWNVVNWDIVLKRLLN